MKQEDLRLIGDIPVKEVTGLSKDFAGKFGSYTVGEMKMFLKRRNPFPKEREIAVPESMDAIGIERLFKAISSGAINLDELLDPFASYRKMPALIFIGPEDIERCFLGPNGENPLGLVPGWAPRDIPMVVSTPRGDIEITPELMQRIIALCSTEEWQTPPILWLCPPKVADLPTSLIQQYLWWGVMHDNMGPGNIRKDTMWSNWFVQQLYPWAKEAASGQWEWKIGYELPRWSTKLKWENQQKETANRGLINPPAVRDALMLNLVAIATGKKLRTSTYARTNTIYDGHPLYVCFHGDSLSVDQDWSPADVGGSLGAAVEGVPLELVS